MGGGLCVLIGTLVVGWWNTRNAREVNANIKQANVNADDVASANLYLDFRKEFREMESRLEEKHAKERAAAKVENDAQIAGIRHDMSLVMDGFQYLCDKIRPTNPEWVATANEIIVGSVKYKRPGDTP